MEMRIAPLVSWPGVPTKDRQKSRFDSTYSQTLNLLERELGMLGAREVVIQVDCDASQVRLDGRLRADARLRGPGVVLSFELDKQPVSFPCDRYPDWHDNLRAIALSLEALRAVDRYGVTRQAEQYRGWMALPAPSQSRDAAMAKVYELAGVPRSFTFETARKNALAKCHPDRNGGATKLWDEIQAALTVLEE